MHEQVAELIAVLGDVDHPHVRAEQLIAARRERLGQVDRGLAAELSQNARRRR
jgi:hypothetical protein